MEENKKNGQVLALTIGGVLILVVAFFSIAIPAIKNKSAEKNDLQNAENAPAIEAQKISATALRQKIIAKEPLNLIDIRTSEEFANEHMENSKNLSPQNILSSIDKNQFYIIIDNGTGGNGENLTAALNDSNYKNAFYLEGGFSGWKNSNLPTVSAGKEDSIIDQSKVTYLSFDQLKTYLEKENEIMLVDLRGADSFAQEHLKNAVNIPIEQIEDQKKELSYTKDIILYDDNDGTSAFQAAVRLFDLNIFNAYAVSDGLSTLKQKGMETVQ